MCAKKCGDLLTNILLRPAPALILNPKGATNLSHLGNSALLRIFYDRGSRMNKNPESGTLFSEQWWRVTLSSIGDGVIATDETGNVSFLNSAAERLTGWNHQEAQGRRLEEVFQIVNEMTGTGVENPVQKVLEKGHVVGLANHTILISRKGGRLPIDDSAARFATIPARWWAWC